MIIIDELTPLIDYGYVTMNKDNSWTWWPKKPSLDRDGHWYIKEPSTSSTNRARYPTRLNIIFNIKPADDYTKSLRKCGRINNETN